MNILNQNKIRVGIIRGGVGDGYETSLKEGGYIISCIFENLYPKYKPIDIFIDKEGQWHISGIPVSPADLLHRIDVAWNSSHHSYSNVLNNLSISHISVPVFSYFLNNKDRLKEHLKEINIKMPRHILIPPYQEDIDGPKDKYIFRKAREVLEKFGGPWIIKSFTDVSDKGIYVAKTFEKLMFAIGELASFDKSILVEELIEGKKAGVHTIRDFRKQDYYSLFPFEHKDDNVFSTGNFSSTEKEELLNMSKNICKFLNVENYLLTNFVLNKNRGIYLSNIDFSPDFSPDSHFNKSCEEIGINGHNILEHMLKKNLSFNK